MGDLRVILNNRSLRDLNRCSGESPERGAENMRGIRRFKIDFFDFYTTDSNTMETIRRALHAVSLYSNDHVGYIKERSIELGPQDCTSSFT
ncbi:hypothetical protein HanRHA438_Chr09g0428521 [Helianthus annuus]|nr:hypothetical protein HanXRQr2_Chr09g0416311 [Helianthus annuus]KAJ0528186.1 hypothetical protein HanHA300_Chr09g0342401 [Helianthus annuus]KAJ0713488.1 hypothetical protein HanOQP8_Chr09g0346411 [Helianthus annuus]KAJ0890860.1 hypothetical protein HanRHA438_Chr09g0428521 [Helianthus annuus]KAJ0895618.1 hypothetical protein HanPSC8_Chr09g0402601 [Helianthus annuus]